MRLVFFLRIIFCAAIACAATAATAGEHWRHLEPQAQRPVEPADFFTGLDGSVWLFGNDGVRRVDANGAMAGWLPESRAGAYTSGRPTFDNGAVVDWSNNCQLARLDATLRVRWTRQFTSYCAYAPVSDGAVWVASYAGELVRLGADGSTERQVVSAAGEPMLAAMPDGGVVALASEGGGPPHSTLARFDRDGVKLWSASRENLYLGGVAASADGTVLVAGVADTGDIVIERFGANGASQSRYAKPRDPGHAEGNLELRLAPDGSASVATTDFQVSTSTRVVYRFGTDGRFLWRKEVCTQPSSTYTPTDAVLPLAGGDTAVACSGDAHARFMRLDAGGTVVADAPLPTLNAKLGLRADGALQALGYVAVTFAKRLYVVDLAGHEADVPVPLAAEPLVFADQYLADDGASYLLSRSSLRADPQKLMLVKVDANGAVAWRRTFDATSPRARLSVAGGQACVAQSRTLTSPWPSGWPEPPPPPPPAPVRIDCVGSADGADRWSRAWPADGAQHFFSALDNGTFVHLSSQGGTYVIVRHDGAGTEVANVGRSGAVQSAAIDTNGDIAAGVYDAVTRDRSVVRYDAAGGAQSTKVAAYAFEVLAIVQGRMLVITGLTSGSVYEWYGVDGRLAWSRRVESLVAPPAVDRTGTSVYLAEQLSSPTSERPGVRVVRLHAVDGTTAWSGVPVFLRPLGASRRGVVLDASGGQVVLAHATRGRLHVVRFGVSDGASRGEQFEACDTYCGLIEAAAVGANGTVRVALPIESDTATGTTTAVVALPDTFAQPAVRLDQPGLAGAWWAPYANGEGFVADWLPASRTWFMPWFTFTPSGGSSGADAQRWYAIAGQVPESATSAELPILQTTGGSFDAGGGVTSRQVGTAMLRFTDCDNGTLRYAFDAGVNDGATGTVTLSRLSPATQDCVQADGSVQARTTMPANGFDARMSGSWFEEATSGQGLQFTVQPGGVFFAPWFTFDPAGTSEPGDPGRQRWYALQGSLATAANGRAELVIGQALGGEFDEVPATRQLAVGAATLTMTACDRATLDYRFDTGEAAGDLGGRTGSIALSKIGGCAP